MHNNRKEKLIKFLFTGNRFKSSLLSVLLVIALLFVPLTGCSGAHDTEDTESSFSSEINSNSESETVSESEQDPTNETESETETESDKDTEVAQTPDTDTQKPDTVTKPSDNTDNNNGSSNTENNNTDNSNTGNNNTNNNNSNTGNNNTNNNNGNTGNNNTDNNNSNTGNNNNITGTDLNTPGISLSDIPAYSKDYYIVLNNNTPHFSTQNLATTSYEYYSELDSLGRCGVAYACLGQDLMPTGDRGSISSVKPSGWHSTSYGCVPGSSLYNRSHLIAWSLAGEDANKQNLITGTQHMNQIEMTKFEDMVRDYIKETGNHVLYRVTPFFDGKNLVATGVQMEAWSIEDQGEAICFNVFIYNVQDGIEIDYATGDSRETNTGSSEENTTPDTAKYMVNKNNGKIHKIDCSSVQATAEKNRVFFDTYEEALAYSKSIQSDDSKRFCGNCHPEEGH